MTIPTRCGAFTGTLRRNGPCLAATVSAVVIISPILALSSGSVGNRVALATGARSTLINGGSFAVRGNVLGTSALQFTAATKGGV